MQVLPMMEGKTGKTYFSGRISNRVASMRFGRFDSKVRRRLLDYDGEDTAVTMSKCQVKRGQHDGDRMGELVGVGGF